MELFTERLKRLRIARNMSQRRLAELIGIDHRAVIRFEEGSGKPRFESLRAMARHLHVSIDYLMTGHESPHAGLYRAISPNKD